MQLVPLRLGGDDKQVTVSLPNGDTVTQLMIKGEPRWGCTS
jgi:hypothetical protein